MTDTPRKPTPEEVIERLWRNVPDLRSQRMVTFVLPQDLPALEAKVAERYAAIFGGPRHSSNPDDYRHHARIALDAIFGENR